MRKTAMMAILGILLCGMTAAAIDVYEEELSKTRGISVEFINYEGPHTKIETIEEITSIGRYLGSRIAAGAASANYGGRYRVIHAVDPAVKSGLDADVFIIESGAVVDHIRNLRYMISGFLQEAYRYSAADAYILAEFVTVYNAVHRGDMAYFGTMYKQVVMRNIAETNAGIARVYYEWPGKTRMLIPLTERAADGGLGSLDSDALTGEEVIEELRRQDDRGLEERKEITELKEREVEEEQIRIDERAAELSERERALEEDRAALERETGDASNAAVAREEIAGTESRVREEEERIAAERTAVEEAQRQVDERQDQIRRDREGIVSDERAMITEQEETAMMEAESRTAAARAGIAARHIPVLLVSGVAGETLGRLVLVDAATGNIRTRSVLNTVRNQRFDVLERGFLVLAGKTEGTGAVRLVILDPESLEVIVEGADDIYPGSVVKITADTVYAVAAAGAGYRIAAFDARLGKAAQSDMEVLPYTALSIDQGRLYLQDSSGNLIILRADNLRWIAE